MKVHIFILHIYCECNVAVSPGEFFQASPGLEKLPIGWIDDDDYVYECDRQIFLYCKIIMYMLGAIVHQSFLLSLFIIDQIKVPVFLKYTVLSDCYYYYYYCYYPTAV